MLSRIIPLVLCFASLAAGQNSSTSFRADTTLVLVPVAVTDKTNRYVLGLERENFQVFEDGAQQKIAYFSNEDAPLSVGLILDISGSIGAKLSTSRRAIAEFLKTLNASDEAFLVECADKAEVTLPFTHDIGAIGQRVNATAAGGLTALLDAVRLGIEQMKDAKNPRKALLILSDGGDNNSHYTPQQVQELVREADVQIYSMGVFEPLSLLLSASEIGGPRLLSEISDQTGGRALAATGAKDLPGIASRIALELRNQYVLAYSPANGKRDGKYRHVQVKLQAPDGLADLKARWRLGYYAPSE